MKSFFKALAGLSVMATVTGAQIQSLHAESRVIVERKIAHFGSPVEWRLRCVKWAKPWPGAKICIGHAYENLQHKFYLRVTGPEADEALKNQIAKALEVAAAAAIATGIATPSPEPMARVAAALAAAKIAFVGYLSSVGLKDFVRQYEIRIDHEAGW
ncbi:hypothetical protein [Mesorhizobium sp. CA16]|uniref:hypothetical protein n=1 Tax=Mesorhizobium sp. CA16 TaxID=588496 RepID=UPI001CCA4FA0|nr:hypothetical protein [Mesorhizobium sp. CA16]MBZ9915822.1 hypothetical protein [Mesorhizobium sp. CA16]